MNKKSNLIEITHREILVPVRVKERWRKRNWESLSANQRKRPYRTYTSMPLTPCNLIQVQKQYMPADFKPDHTLSKYIKFYQATLTTYELEFVREKEFIQFRVPMTEIESGIFKGILHEADWNPDTNYYEVSGGFCALAKYGELLSNHFADSRAYRRILAAFDFGGRIPERRIQLSGDTQRFKIYFEYDEALIKTVKKYGAKWDNRRRIWNAAMGMNAVLLAKQLGSEGFKCSGEIIQLIENYESDRPFSYEVSGEQITLRNLPVPEVHAFLSPRKQATFNSVSETWSIKPNYEISKFLKEALAAKFDQKTIGWLREFVNSADLLDRLSSNGKIVHEQDEPIPEGLALFRGERLYTICKKAKISYRPAVSYGSRPFAKSIGVFILDSDKPKFEAQSKQALDAYMSNESDAMTRFTANPKRTKLRIHVDATPFRWAFKVMNGSNQMLLTESGSVTAEPATVNTGEYQALIEGLKWLEQHPCKEALLLSDSQTIIRQVKGSPVKSAHLKELRDEAQKRLQSCSDHTPTSVCWQPGRRNKADAASRHKDYFHALEKRNSDRY